jgi:SAM-dependent methyltransferase
MDLKKAFEDLKPWVTKFTIKGKDYGGDFDAMNDKRVKEFFRYFPNVKTILELGSLEGGHTFALSRFPGVERVVAIEGRKSNVDKAQFIQQMLDIQNVEFVVANLESFDFSTKGPFDAVFCVGLLYHLPKPWTLIEKSSKASQNLFLWTHYAPEKEANLEMNGYRGVNYKEFGLSDPLSGMSPQSFWPTLDHLKRMLLYYGFSKTTIIENDENHPHGPCITLAAETPT